MMCLLSVLCTHPVGHPDQLGRDAVQWVVGEGVLHVPEHVGG